MSALPPFLIGLQQKLAEEKTKGSAWKIIDEYFSFFSRECIDEELWRLTVGVLTNDTIELEKANDRHDIIFFFEYTKMFYEAVHLLYTRHKNNNSQ